MPGSYSIVILRLWRSIISVFFSFIHCVQQRWAKCFRYFSCFEFLIRKYLFYWLWHFYWRCYFWLNRLGFFKLVIKYFTFLEFSLSVLALWNVVFEIKNRQSRRRGNCCILARHSVLINVLTWHNIYKFPRNSFYQLGD